MFFLAIAATDTAFLIACLSLQAILIIFCSLLTKNPLTQEIIFRSIFLTTLSFSTKCGVEFSDSWVTCSSAIFPSHRKSRVTTAATLP